VATALALFLLVACGGSGSKSATIHVPFDSSVSSPSELRGRLQQWSTEVTHACLRGAESVKVVFDGSGAPPPEYLDCKSGDRLTPPTT
jgi:hypothetical protein